MKKLSFLFLVVFAATVVLCNSCQREESLGEVQTENNSLAYLSVDPTFLSNFNMSEDSENAIFFEALDRAVDFNGTPRLKVQSPKEINISNDLFVFFKQLVCNSNNALKTRANESRTDCVPCTVAQVYEDLLGNGNNSKRVKLVYEKLWKAVQNRFGNEGVPLKKYQQILSYFFSYVKTYSVAPKNYTWHYNPLFGKAEFHIIAVIQTDDELSYHSVTLQCTRLNSEGKYVALYRDEQNNCVGACELSKIVATFEVYAPKDEETVLEQQLIIL